MSESAVPAPQAPLTRRQIREAERAREAAAERERAAAAERDREAVAERARQAVPMTPATSAKPTTPSTPATPAAPAVPVLPAASAVTRERDSARHESDTAETEVLDTSQALASRRSLRPALRRTPSRAPRRSWAPRAAVLGAMGALTIVAPLTGFAAPEAEPAAAAVVPQRSVLEVLDAQAANVALAAVPASLLKDPAASSRATVLQTSRAADRNALTCAPLDGASGARAAVTERVEQFVRPLVDGTYRNSSHYGNRSHPLSGAYSFHTGTDYAAPLGTPIYAIADGTVEYVGAGKDGRSSMLVILRHEIDGQTVYSWYGHMYRNGIHVTEGQQVSAGEPIAEVGNNGNSTGPHLHFEIHLDDEGTTTDPLPWLEKLGAVEVAALC